MAIEGKRREQKDYAKKVGLIEVSVVAINPTEEEYKDILGIELNEDSKATEYLGETRDGNPYVRVDVWVASTKKVDGKSVYQDKISYFLENRERENKDLTKKQYVNSIGLCTWADDPNNLPDWFTGKGKTPRTYRVANIGEEEFMTFLRSWLNQLDLSDGDANLQLEWKQIMKGKIEWREYIGCEYTGPFVVTSIIKTVERDGEIKEYQSIYNKGFVPSFALKNFRLINYDDEAVVERLRNTKNLKAHEKFVLNIKGTYGCKDFYILKDLQDYDPTMNIAATDSTLVESDSPQY